MPHSLSRKRTKQEKIDLEMNKFLTIAKLKTLELDKVLKHKNDLSKLDGINKIIPKIQETIKNWERDLQNE